MQKLIVHRLGPIEHCELDIKDFMVFTGSQASGKSTIAKSVFFFKNIKNVFYSLLRKRYLLKDTEVMTELFFPDYLLQELRSVFIQIFGSPWNMDESMFVQYYYGDDKLVSVSLANKGASTEIFIYLSTSISEFVNSVDCSFQERRAVLTDDLTQAQRELDAFFEDDAEPIYIPAGRSMITLLGAQLNYIYSSMDDMQRKNLDYCTQNFLERVMQIKPAFHQGLPQLIAYALSFTSKKCDQNTLLDAAELMNQILQGQYRNIDGDERLLVAQDRYVKINLASSGQQEALWILNVVIYSLLGDRKSCFIIEEPESHLFPNAQKLMAEFISLASCGGRNQVLVTTHSPYILGAVNNLLYANKISKSVDEKLLEEIIPRNRWLDFQNLGAYYIHNGELQACVDTESEAIENEVIDSASADINMDYDKMVLLKEKYT